MTTLGTMVRRIRTDLNRGSAVDGRIREAICDAIAHFGARRLGFNQNRSTTILQSAQEFLALPSDWVEIDHLRLEPGAERYPLTEVTYDWIEDEQRGTASEGQPTRFAIHARELRFYPIPERTYTLVGSFLCSLTEISVSAADSATNAWMTEGEQLVRTYAIGDLYVHYVGGSEAVRGAALKLEAEEVLLPALERRAAREVTSGRMRAFI